MARVISVALSGVESSFEFKSIDRAALYGKRRRIALDALEQPCSRASILEDGSMVLKSGMTGQGYFLSDGTFLKQGELQGFDTTGKPLEKVPSTLGVTQELIGPVEPSKVLDMRIASIYLLDAESIHENLSASLDRGDIYEFMFNYREDYQAETGVLLRNKSGTFALIGAPLEYEWSEFNVVSELPATDEDSDDDLDFEMF
jgi:hypothetical protein